MASKTKTPPSKPGITAAFIRDFQAAYSTLEMTLPFGTPNLRTRLEISDVLLRCIRGAMGGYESHEQRITMGSKALGKASRAALKKLGFQITQPDPHSIRISWKAVPSI